MQLTVEQDAIDQFGEIAREFFQQILEMDADDPLLTDLSSLSDFRFGGPTPEGLLDLNSSLKELNRVWDEWVLQRVQDYYGFAPQTTYETLVQFFARVESSRLPVTLH